MSDFSWSAVAGRLSHHRISNCFVCTDHFRDAISETPQVPLLGDNLKAPVHIFWIFCCKARLWYIWNGLMAKDPTELTNKGTKLAVYLWPLFAKLLQQLKVVSRSFRSNKLNPNGYQTLWDRIYYMLGWIEGGGVVSIALGLAGKWKMQ